MAGGGKFAQLVPNHVFGDVDRNMPSTIMNRDGVPHHLREDGAVAAPCAENLLLTTGIHRFNLAK